MPPDIGIVSADANSWITLSDFPGIKLNGSAFADWRAGFPATMSPDSIIWATEKKYWNRLDLMADTPADLHDWMLEYIAVSNLSRADMRELQANILYWHRVLLGMLYDSAYNVGGVAPIASASWEVVSISSGQIVVKFQAGDQDPRALVTTAVIVNPDWVGPNLGEDHYISESTYFPLPNFCVVQLLDPSSLQFHGGLVAYAIDCSQSLAEDENFTLLTKGTFGATWNIQIDPDDTTPIRAKVWFYRHHVREQWTNLRDDYPLLVEYAAPFDIAAPTSIPYTISATKIVVPHNPTSANEWVRIVKLNGSGAEMGDIPPTGKIEVTNTVAPNHISKLDLTGVDLTGVATVRLYHYIESVTGTIRAMQNRCRFDNPDFSESWGAAGAGGGVHHCAMRGLASTEGAGDYKPGGCFETTCSAWAFDNGPVSPMDPGLIQQLIFSLPWKLVQILEGFAYDMLSRIGPPSLFSLAGPEIQLADGYHPQVRYTLETGACMKRREAGASLFNVPGFFKYLEWATAAPVFTKPLTWLTDGPGGNKWARDPQFPGAEDIQLVQQSQCTGSDPGVHPYTGVMAGRVGQFQRFRENYVVIMHNLTPTLAVGTTNYSGNTFERGSFTGIDGAPHNEYRAKMALVPLRHDRATDNAWGGYKRNAQVVGPAVFIDNEHIALYLEHGAVFCSTFTGTNRQEKVSTWMQGDGHVTLPSEFQVRNWANPSHRIGSDHSKCEAGDVAGIDGETGLHRLFIVNAEACYGGGGQYPSEVRTGSFKPESGQTGYVQESQGYFVLLLTAGRRLDDVADQIVIKRDFPFPLDQAVTLEEDFGGDDAAIGAKPYGMVKDTYFYKEILQDDGTYRVHILVSRMNDTSAVLDRNLTVYYKTVLIAGGGSPATNQVTWDLRTDASLGWATLKCSFTLPYPINSIVSVEALRGDGEAVALAASGSAPTYYSVFSLTHYYPVIVDDTHVDIYVSPEYGGDALHVFFDYLSGGLGLAEGVWYDQNVNFHGLYIPGSLQAAQGSLPAQHKAWSARRARVVLFDRRGHWRARASENPDWFDGKTLVVANDGVFKDDTIEVEFREGVSGAPDVIGFGADGVIYLLEYDAGDDVSITGTFAVRMWEALAKEPDALVASLESMLEGIPLGKTPIIIPGIADVTAIAGSQETTCNTGTGDEEFSVSYSSVEGESGPNYASILIQKDAIGGPDNIFVSVELIHAALAIQTFPWRIYQLDRNGFPDSIGEAKAVISLSNVLCTIEHAKLFIVSEDDIPPPTEGRSYYGQPIDILGSPDKVRVHEYWTETPDEVALTPYLMGVFMDGGDVKIKFLGGGATSGFTAKNNHPAVQAGISGVEGYLQTVMAWKDRAIGFIDMVIPNEVPIVGDDITDEAVVAALMSAMLTGSMACELVGRNPSDTEDIYMLTGEIAWKTFSWGNLSIGNINTGLTGDIALPARARVMSDYFTRQD